MRAFVTHFPSPPPKLEIGSKTCRRETPLNFRVKPRASAAASYNTVVIIPTGIGASIGGYAGDAIPALRLIASIADNVITHPNVLNGALMYWPLSNAMYVEGYTLNQFAAGRCALKKTSNRSNRVGLVFDSAMDPVAILRHKQAAEAARATLGLRIEQFAVTEKPLQVQLATGACGASWGQISNSAYLFGAVKQLLSAGCDAIAIVAKFPDDEDETQLANYRAGNGVDAIAGAEAVISHLVSREFGVPCAHAPSLPPLDADDSVSPKSAAEELGYTFLSCVLVGLSKAPKPIAAGGRYDATTIISDDIDSVVVPADAFGGSALMSLARKRDVLIIAVRENETALDVSPESVGIDQSRVVFATSYAEAAGFLAAHKAGIDITALGSCVAPLAQAW